MLWTWAALTQIRLIFRSLMWNRISKHMNSDTVSHILTGILIWVSTVWCSRYNRIELIKLEATCYIQFIPKFIYGISYFSKSDVWKTFLPDCTFVVGFALELDDIHQILIAFETVHFHSISLHFSSIFNFLICASSHI